jgi:uncharacterized iron-regulated membrane protein
MGMWNPGWHRAHRWLGLLLGLQVLFWTGSVLFFTSVDIQRVKAEHLVREVPPTDLRAGAADRLPLSAVLAAAPDPVRQAELVIVDARPMWRLQPVAATAPVRLVDAQTGTVVSPLDEATARRIAEEDYGGGTPVTGARLITADAPIEYRGKLPVWQVAFAEDEGLRLYVAADSGKVVARRTNTWRVYDFLWSLHIMDYSGHEDFNHPLVIAFAALAMLFTASGGVLVWRRFRPRRKPTP